VAKTFPLAEAAAALRYLVEAPPLVGSSSQSEERTYYKLLAEKDDET
jgi:hypothetical protein